MQFKRIPLRVTPLPSAVRTLEAKRAALAELLRAPALPSYLARVLGGPRAINAPRGSPRPTSPGPGIKSRAALHIVRTGKQEG